MKVIGFQFTSSSSKLLKQYTFLVLENGKAIRFWGARKNSQGVIQNGTGTVKLEDVSFNPQNLFLVLNSEFNDKVSKSDYDGVSYEFKGMEYTGLSDDADDLKIRTEARSLAEAWLAQVDDSFNSQFNVSKNNYDNIRADRMNIESFARGGTSGVTMKAGSKASTTTAADTATAKVVVRKYFTEIEEVAQGKKVLRPNGEEYKPREIMGHTDIALLRQFRKITIYPRLAGPPGAGKTACVEGAFGDELITVSGHGDMTVANFVGTHMPLPDGTWKWQDGPLVTAMKEGKVLFVDEGTRIPAEVLNILFSVMDGRNMLRLDDRPDDPIVYGKDGFFVVMGYNPDTLGARQLDEALVSRFRVQIDVKTDHATAKSLGVPAVAIRIAANLEKRDKKDRETGGMGYWVPQMRELLTFRDLVKADAGTDFALATLVASCPRQMDIPTLTQVIKDVAKVDNVGIPALGGLV